MELVLLFYNLLSVRLSMNLLVPFGNHQLISFFGRVRCHLPEHRQEILRACDDIAGTPGGIHNRLDSGDVSAPGLRLQFRLPGRHPVHISLKRIDLAIVSQASEGLCQIPVREGVGTVSLVKHCLGGILNYSIELQLLCDSNKSVSA